MTMSLARVPCQGFSALDSVLRKQLHQELFALQQRAQLIVIYVTHNLVEAFAIGHRLAIVREGRIEQIGTPQAVYQYPASPVVLELLGVIPVMDRARESKAIYK
jgi:molybdate transport system ATP-binding protein